jgi:hypothetical protein
VGQPLFWWMNDAGWLAGVLGCTPSESCLALAIKRRAFGRALPGATGTAAVEHWIKPETNVAGTTATATPTVQPESGSEI